MRWRDPRIEGDAMSDNQSDNDDRPLTTRERQCLDMELRWIKGLFKDWRGRPGATLQFRKRFIGGWSEWENVPTSEHKP